MANWTVKDYWDWNPAFTAGLANFHRQQDRETSVAEAEKDRGLRREEMGLRSEDLAFRRGIEASRESRLRGADLDDLTQKFAAALAYQGAEEDPEFLKNPAARVGWEIGKSKRLEQNERQENWLERYNEQSKLRREFEELKAQLKAKQPNRLELESETVRDPVTFEVLGQRYVPSGTLGSNLLKRATAPVGTNAPPNIIGRVNPKTGKLERTK